VRPAGVAFPLPQGGPQRSGYRAAINPFWGGAVQPDEPGSIFSKPRPRVKVSLETLPGGGDQPAACKMRPISSTASRSEAAAIWKLVWVETSG